MRNLFITTTFLLLSFSGFAQEEIIKKAEKNHLFFHLGPSFPVGDFASKTLTNTEAGFAQTGLTLDISYLRSINDNIGIAATAFYNMNGLDIKKVEQEYGITGVKVDHWQYIGLTAGPVVTIPASDKTKIDFRVLGGIARANSPQINFDGTLMVNEDWATAAVFQAGAGLRTDLSSKLIFFGGLDYKYLRPSFAVVSGAGDVSEDAKQRMSTLNLSVGLGFRF
jgi:hypothetical protein